MPLRFVALDCLSLSKPVSAPGFSSPGFKSSPSKISSASSFCAYSPHKTTRAKGTSTKQVAKAWEEYMEKTGGQRPRAENLVLEYFYTRYPNSRQPALLLLFSLFLTGLEVACFIYTPVMVLCCLYGAEVPGKRNSLEDLEVSEFEGKEDPPEGEFAAIVDQRGQSVQSVQSVQSAQSEKKSKTHVSRVESQGAQSRPESEQSDQSLPQSLRRLYPKVFWFALVPGALSFFAGTFLVLYRFLHGLEWRDAGLFAYYVATLLGLHVIALCTIVFGAYFVSQRVGNWSVFRLCRVLMPMMILAQILYITIFRKVYHRSGVWAQLLVRCVLFTAVRALYTHVFVKQTLMLEDVLSSEGGSEEPPKSSSKTKGKALSENQKSQKFRLDVENVHLVIVFPISLFSVLGRFLQASAPNVWICFAQELVLLAAEFHESMLHVQGQTYVQWLWTARCHPVYRRLVLLGRKARMGWARWRRGDAQRDANFSDDVPIPSWFQPYQMSGRCASARCASAKIKPSQVVPSSQNERGISEERTLAGQNSSTEMKLHFRDQLMRQKVTILFGNMVTTLGIAEGVSCLMAASIWLVLPINPEEVVFGTGPDGEGSEGTVQPLPARTILTNCAIMFLFETFLTDFLVVHYSAKMHRTRPEACIDVAAVWRGRSRASYRKLAWILVAFSCNVGHHIIMSMCISEVAPVEGASGVPSGEKDVEFIFAQCPPDPLWRTGMEVDFARSALGDGST